MQTWGYERYVFNSAVMYKAMLAEQDANKAALTGKSGNEEQDNLDAWSSLVNGGILDEHLR